MAFVDEKVCDSKFTMIQGEIMSLKNFTENKFRTVDDSLQQIKEEIDSKASLEFFRTFTKIFWIFTTVLFLGFVSFSLFLNYRTEDRLNEVFNKVSDINANMTKLHALDELLNKLDIEMKK